MKNIIGANQATGNSNAVKFEFDIIEPHSMGLLLQSMQAAAINATYLSYMDNAPFVLRMDIQGFNELGQNLSTIKPKFFVLKLTGVKFSVNESGSTYKVEAIPYNHQGFASSINISYSDVKLSASGKGHVFDILSSGEGSLTSFLNKVEQKLLEDKEITVKSLKIIKKYLPLLKTITICIDDVRLFRTDIVTAEKYPDLYELINWARLNGLYSVTENDIFIITNRK